MRLRHRGREPVVDTTAFVAPTAVLVGRVRVGAEARILFGAVLDSEASHVDVGRVSIVSENAVLRATAAGEREHPVVVGDHVLVGPHATLLGCTVRDCAFIATGATVLHGAVVERGAVVAVHALVHANTVIPPGFFVPPHTTALGDPVQLYSAADGEALTQAIRALGFSTTAFGVPTAGRDRAAIYRDVTTTRAAEYAAHAHDEVLPPAEADTNP